MCGHSRKDDTQNISIQGNIGLIPFGSKEIKEIN